MMLAFLKLKFNIELYVIILLDGILNMIHNSNQSNCNASGRTTISHLFLQKSCVFEKYSF